MNLSIRKSLRHKEFHCNKKNLIVFILYVREKMDLSWSTVLYNRLLIDFRTMIKTVVLNVSEWSS